MAGDWREHKRRIDEAVDIYAPAMSRYVNDHMVNVKGGEWYGLFLSEVVNNQKLKAGVRETYQKNLDLWEAGKRDPSQDLAVDEFQWIVSSYSEEKLPSQIDDLTPSLRAVAQKRNQARDNKRTLTPEDADDAINACIRVLRTIGDEDAARNVEQIRNVDTSEPTKDPANTRRDNSPGLTPPLPPAITPDMSSPNHSSPPRQRGRMPRQNGEQARLGEANAGALKDAEDPSVAIQAIFKTYRRSMRVYIRATLQRKHFARTGSDGWFRELVLERDGKFDKKRMAEQFEAGESPDAIMDVGNFRHIIQENRAYFHQPLGDGTCDGLFHHIEAARIEFPGHDKDDPYEREVEEVASSCVTILELCRTRKTDAAADQIRRHFQDSDKKLPNDQSLVDGGSSEKDDHEPDPLHDDDRPEQGAAARRREMDTLSDQDPDVRSELESAEREREKRPFFGVALARLWVGNAAKWRSSGGGGAFAAGGEVDEREPVRGRRWKPVAGAILAIIIVALAVLAIVTVSVVSDREGMVDLPEPAVPTPTAEPAQQEQPADDGPPAPEPNTEKDDPSTPLPGTESNGEGGSEPLPSGSGQTPSGSAGEGEPSDSGDGGQAEAGGGEQEGAGQAPPDSVGEGEPSDSGDGGQAEAGGGEQEGAGQAPPGGAGGGGTSDSGGGGETGAGGGEEPERVDCVTDENDKCPTEAGGAGDGGGNIDPESDAMDDDDGSGIQPGALQEEEPGTTIVTASDSHQAEPPGGGTIDPEDGVMDDDDGSGLQPGALQEEEPGTTIVTADDGNPIVPIVVAEDNPIAFINDDGLQPDALEEEEPGTTIVVVDDNPIIVSPAQGAADGDVMEDGG